MMEWAVHVKGKTVHYLVFSANINNVIEKYQIAVVSE